LLAGKADDALDEDPAGATLELREGRSVEDDDVTALRAAIPKWVHCDEIVRLCFAADAGTRAVKRRLHRRRRHAVDVRIGVPAAARRAKPERRHERSGGAHQWKEILVGGQ